VIVKFVVISLLIIAAFAVSEPSTEMSLLKDFAPAMV